MHVVASWGDELKIHIGDPEECGCTHSTLQQAVKLHPLCSTKGFISCLWFE